MFQITDQAILHSHEVKRFHNPSAGGLVFFEGRVRDHNEGFSVKTLEYQCYEAMAIKVGSKIMKDTMKSFDLHDAFCIHRHGHLEIEEVALWVGVSSSHRQDAFIACQFIIDQVKSQVPVWKKEHYVCKDKEPVWVACHACLHHEGHHEPS